MKDRIIQKSFEYFFRKFYNQESFQFYFSPTNLKVYESLILELSKRVFVETLGKNFIWKYCIFQFAYWQDLSLSSHTTKITFSYIFGKKAIQRYFNRDKNYDWQLEDHILVKKFNLSKKEFDKYIDISKSQAEYSNDPIRFRYLNTERGLATCLSQTTLIDRRDSSCLVCKFQTECMELLKKNYPNLHKNRYGRK